ncbi:hypothetical protein GF325_03130 [Candidatus Bathyarchaeota archaeon]|nr:hypothetical protein [Candidatus Bathyarchaeota archaeon]
MSAPVIEQPVRSPQKHEPTSTNKDQEIDTMDVFYSDVRREDVRRGFFNFRKVLLAVSIILIGVVLMMITEIMANINRGDNIFAGSTLVGENILIPWIDWHDWLEALSWTLGVIAALIIALILTNIAIIMYHDKAIPKGDLARGLNATAISERDISIRQSFKEQFGPIYEDMKKGKVSLISQGVKPSMVPLKGKAGLPKIKMPPKVAVPIPGSMKTPGKPSGGAPPVPSLVTKKKQSGPVTGEKKIFVRCNKCEKTLSVSIPKGMVLDNELEVVPISIIHGEGEEKHVLTVFLDPDFKSRRDRISEMVILE